MAKRPDADVKLEPIQARLRQLLDEKPMTQSELAEKAGIAPAAVSRFMNEERDLRAEHFLSIARVLGLSVAELVAGTTAQSVLLDWVPRERYDQAERERLAALTALEAAQAETKGRLAELAALNASLATLRKEHADLQLRESQVTAETQRLLAVATESEQKLGECRAAYERAQLTIRTFQDQLTQTRQQLVASKNGAMGTAAVGALLGGIVVAAMNTGTGRGRRS